MAKVYTPSSLGGVKFDAIISRDRTYEAEVPTYPVESGFPVSDAVLRSPLALNVTAFISDTPVTWKRQLGNTRSRVSKVVKQLENLYFAGEPVTFITGNKVYTNMAITSITVPETEEMKTAVEVSISLKQVEVTKAKTTTIPSSYGMSGTTGDSGDPRVPRRKRKKDSSPKRVRLFLACSRKNKKGREKGCLLYLCLI